MKITRSNWILGLGIVMTIALSACSSGTPTALPTRLATQTPWIIERVITATPEPPIATTIPPSIPVRTPTKSRNCQAGSANRQTTGRAARCCRFTNNGSTGVFGWCGFVALSGEWRAAKYT